MKVHNTEIRTLSLSPLEASKLSAIGIRGVGISNGILGWGLLSACSRAMAWKTKSNVLVFLFLEREKDTDIQIIQGNSSTDSRTLRLLTSAWFVTSRAE